MTTEQHIILYNIGMKLSCNNSRGWHLCSNKRNYEYFVFWSEVSEKSTRKFVGAVGKKKIQLKRKTGKEKVSLDERVPVCMKYTAKERVEMVWQQPCEQAECDSLVKELGFLLAPCVRNVAIEKTLVLKENADKWRMPMIDFADAFDEGALLAHFRSLIRCFLEEAVLGNKGTDIIVRMEDLLHNWEKIYNEKEDILNKIENYMKIIRMGIENASSLFFDGEYSSSGINNNLNKKRNAGDCLSFLLPGDSNRERFQECATVLAAFLKAYAKDDAAELLSLLQKYVDKNVQINKIKRLAKIDLNSVKAKIANAKLIVRYLDDDIKYSSGELLECIA